MKKTATVLILITAMFAVFISGLVIGRKSATSVPLADVSHLIPTDPYEPENLPSQELIGNKININTASAETLALLPGISMTRAQQIVDYRQANGPYTHIEQLKMIEGLGETRFDNIAKYITVGE